MAGDNVVTVEEMDTDDITQVSICAKCIILSVFVIRILLPLVHSHLPIRRYVSSLFGLLFIIKDGWKITGATNMDHIPDVAVRVEV